MKTLSKYLGLVLPCVVVLSTTPCYADNAPLDFDKMMQSTGLDIDSKKLLAHEIVVLARADQESVDSEIALNMLLYVKAPYEKVIKELHNGDNQLTKYPGALAVQIDDPTTPKKYFHKLAFTQNEHKEVETLFAYKEGDTYNLSSAEIARLRVLANTAKNDKTVAAASFYKELLEERLKIYQTKGIHSIPSYRQSGENIDVAKDFTESAKKLTFLQHWFPLFYKNFLNYPKASVDGNIHKFFWIKDGMEDRPVFILKHQMVKEEKNGTIIAERQFFISHGLDALQIGIFCLPYKEGTIIGMGAQTFTGKVTGFGSYVAHKVGRFQMEKQIKPMFENLQKKFTHK